MSRQMAFQLTYAQLVEKWAVIVRHGGRAKEYENVGKWIDSVTEDQAERDKLMAAYAVLHNSTKLKRAITDVAKVIVWRDKDGKPSDLQVEFRRA